jgi:hypothetical protein
LKRNTVPIGLVLLLLAVDLVTNQTGPRIVPLACSVLVVIVIFATTLVRANQSRADGSNPVANGVWAQRPLIFLAGTTLILSSIANYHSHPWVSLGLIVISLALISFSIHRIGKFSRSRPQFASQTGGGSDPSPDSAHQTSKRGPS